MSEQEGIRTTWESPLVIILNKNHNDIFVLIFNAIYINTYADGNKIEIAGETIEFAMNEEHAFLRKDSSHRDVVRQ